MSEELKPLLHGPLDERARSVLVSGLEDGPSAQQIERAALALGLSTSVAIAATASAKLGGAKIQSAGLTLVLKWLGTGAIAGLVTSAALTLAPGSAPAPSTPAEQATPADVVATAPAIAPREPSSVVAQPKPERAPPRASFVQAPSTAPTSEPTPPPGASVARFPNRSEQLRAETALLDEARRALARGDASVALSRLTTYSERFSEPLLAPEAALLRVRALKAAGRTNEARSLAERELRTSADDAYAERIRRAAGIRAAPAASASKPPSASF